MYTKQLFIILAVISITAQAGCARGRNPRPQRAVKSQDSVPKTTGVQIKPCRLPFSVKSVTIAGDHGEFLSRAIKSELYRFGVAPATSGVTIVGTTVWEQGASQDGPISLSAEVQGRPFAASVTTWYPFSGQAVPDLARRVVKDFCTSAAVSK